MWDPQRLTTLWASMACYRDNYTAIFLGSASREVWQEVAGQRVRLHFRGRWRGDVLNLSSFITHTHPTIIISVSRCGGGVEYRHRDPASRRRRRKGKSRIWGSKIWPRVPRDSNQKMTALVRASSNFKRQTRPLVRENAPHQQTRNCLTVIKIWS
jgi:hypothetical protein